MFSTQVVPAGQSGVSRWLVPGGMQIGRPTYMAYYQQQPSQQLPLAATRKRPPRGCCCRPCVALVVSVITLLLLLAVTLVLVFLIPRGPEFTTDIVVEVSTLEYPYIENLLQRDARLFFDYENGFCRNLRMIITEESYQVGADYGDCQLQAISRYIEDSEPMNIGSIFTLKVTLESSSRITLFTVDRVVDAIIEAVTAGEVSGRLLFYFEGTRVLNFPGLRDPVFPATVDVFLFLSIGVPGLPYDPDFRENNPEEFERLQTAFCEHASALMTDPQVTLSDCYISSITPLDVRRRRRRKRQSDRGSLINLDIVLSAPAAVEDSITTELETLAEMAYSDMSIGGFQTSDANAQSSLTALTTTPSTTQPASTTATGSPGTTPTGSPNTGTTPTGPPNTGTTPTGPPNTGTTPTGPPNTGTTPTGPPNPGTFPTGTTNPGTTPTGTTNSGTTPTGTTNSGTTPTGTTNSGTTPTGTTNSGTTPTGTTNSGTTPTGTTNSGTSSTGPPNSGTTPTGTPNNGTTTPPPTTPPPTTPPPTTPPPTTPPQAGPP